MHEGWPCLRLVLLGLAALVSVPAAACSGPFAIGEVTRTLVDPARGNRSVGVVIRYPAQAAGVAAPPVADCAFPALVYGHGFTISHLAYGYLSQALVPQGFVIAFPSTESGIAPNHPQFGADLAFVARQLASDPLLGASLGSARALGGHSMGGGAAFLGAAQNADVQALFAMAPAETNPSAIAAAANISIPTRILIGSRDCVTPAAQHAQPMFAALATPAADKSLLEIAGASHCQFSDGALTCSIGESSCGGSATITAGAQHEASLNLLREWLARRLSNRLTEDGFE